jgi:secreted trypsin-like serine protease
LTQKLSTKIKVIRYFAKMLFAPTVSHPFMVAIVKKGSTYLLTFCGSSLVAPMTVVTAAHCVDNKNPNELLVNIFEYIFFNY